MSKESDRSYENQPRINTALDSSSQKRSKRSFNQACLDKNDNNDSDQNNNKDMQFELNSEFDETENSTGSDEKNILKTNRSALTILTKT